MKRIALLLFVLFCSVSLFAQNRAQLKGAIRNTQGSPLEGVTITVIPSGHSTISDGSGLFQIRNIPAGNRTIRFSSVGYLTQDKAVLLKAGETVSLEIEMQPAQNVLEEVSVSAAINSPGEVRRMDDVQHNFIAAGKKNEVITVDGMNANLAEKTGRQLFAKIPGVFVYDMDGSGNQINISTRGLDPHRSWEYNVRLNGIMTNSDIYGYPASHYSPPMEAISRIELIRGTSSLQYGAEFGGMINYVTKGADTSKPLSFESINSVGSYGLLSTYSAVGGRSGRFTYYAYLSKRVSDGYRKNGRSDYEAQSASLAYRISDKAELKAELAHMEYLYQVPGPLTDEQFGNDPRQATRSRNYFNPDIYVPSLSLDWALSDRTRLFWTASAVLGARNSVQFLDFATIKDSINPETNAYKARQVDIDGFNSYTTELRLMHYYGIGKMRNTLNGGVRYINNNLHRQQLGVGTTGTDFDLSLTQPGYGRDLHYKTGNLAVFAENLVRITDRFSVTPGLRFEVGATDMSGTIRYYDPGDVPNRIEHHFPLFGLSAQYTLRGNGQLYGGWSQAYRPVIFADIIPPTALDRTDKDLKDATGFNFEIGIRSRQQGWFHYDLSLFALKYNNRLGSLIITEGGSNYVLKTNVGTSLTKGVELFAEIRPLQLTYGANSRVRLSLFTATSYFDATYQKGSVVVGGTNKSVKGNRLETVPEWISRNGINFGIDRFTATFQHNYVGKSFSDALNTPQPNVTGSAGPVPAYHVFDLNTSYRLNSLILFKLGVNNLANKQYFTKRPTGYPGQGIFPSDGRSIVGSVTFKL